jgi:hypothetical protein
MVEENIKCPVCGKVGIPNYLSEDTTCPCCGTDLSIFRVIDQIPQAAPKNKNFWMPIAIAAVFAAMVMGGILLFRMPMAQTDESQTQQIACLEDSITSLNNKLADLQRRQIVPSGGFTYVIRKGDSFWSISKRFYHTGTRYEEIAKANGLAVNSKLNIGDTIIVK